MVSSTGGEEPPPPKRSENCSQNEPLGRPLLRGGGEVRVGLVSTESLQRFWHERVGRALNFTLGGGPRFESGRGLKYLQNGPFHNYRVPLG